MNRTPLQQLDDMKFHGRMTVGGALARHEVAAELIATHEADKRANWTAKEWNARLAELGKDRRKMRAYIDDEMRKP